MACDQVVVFVPRPKFNEGSAFTSVAYFRERSTSLASAPSVAKYRIDCLSTARTLQDWTSLTPAASINIPITATHNAIQDSSNEWETKQLTVASEPGASTQFRDTATWTVTNLFGSP